MCMILSGTGLCLFTCVVAAADDLEVRGDGAEIGVGCAVGEVPKAEGLANFTRG